MTRRPLQPAALAACALLAGCVAPNPGSGQPGARDASPQAVNQRPPIENQPQQPRQRTTYTVAADLLFAPGNFDVTANGRTTLNDIIPKLRGLKDSKIVVYGYTDDQKIGPPLKNLGIDTNLDLSSRRADAAANYLTAHGVDAMIVSARGRGDTHPVAPNSTPAGRAQNRRIEIVVEGAGS